MSLAQVLSTYLNLNILIVIAFVGLSLLKTIKPLRASEELKLHYMIALIISAITAIHPFLPRNEVFAPAAKVWSAQSIESFSRDYTAPDKGGYLSLPTPFGASTLQADQVAITWGVLVAILLLAGGIFIGRDLYVLLKIKGQSFLVRKIGRTKILINENIQVPFSYWLPGEANIIVPSSLLNRTEEYKMAIAHELQHHRHGDTRWVYAIWGLKLLCIINPAIHLWSRLISEIQEFACDETLVDQHKVESQAYARCLVEVAQTAIHQKHVPVCATGLTFLVERNLLKRRIEKMLTKTSNNSGRSISAAAGLILVALMGATAYASKGLVQDRRVSMAQAQAMAARAQSDAGFPVVVNDRVVTQLNRYVGTPEGREFIRNALIRMQSYKETINKYLQAYNVPSEILAMPIIESGYQNLKQGQYSSTNRSAGLWQFIPETATKFGLDVFPEKDDRLDVFLETDAAARYLQYNNLRFKDWQLSVLSYNMGEEAVQRGIKELGSRDAWTLIRNGYEGDKDYLPKLMAAILIMKNPESVQQ